MSSALEFVSTIILVEESRNGEAESVRLGKAIYAQLLREIGPRCVFPVRDAEKGKADVMVNGIPVWCDPTIGDNAGDVIVRKR